MSLRLFNAVTALGVCPATIQTQESICRFLALAGFSFRPAVLRRVHVMVLFTGRSCGHFVFLLACAGWFWRPHHFFDSFPSAPCPE